MSRIRRDERGSMAVELVILAPVLMMFAMLVVAGGRYVGAEGDVEAAARDAARAASLESDRGAAIQAANATVVASLDEIDGADCRHTISTEWEADGFVRVRVSCDVPYGDLGLLGLPGHVTVDAESYVRLDPYRRFE
jgi:Flp pilus assembly protein TadG